MVKYKLEVDRTLCIACGACYSSDPVHFEPDQTRKSTVVDGKTDDNLSIGTFEDDAIEEVREVQDSCPVSAINTTES